MTCHLQCPSGHQGQTGLRPFRLSNLSVKRELVIPTGVLWLARIPKLELGPTVRDHLAVREGEGHELVIVVVPRAHETKALQVAQVATGAVVHVDLRCIVPVTRVLDVLKKKDQRLGGHVNDREFRRAIDAVVIHG